jgi:beta-N-acetylhexosaminidase
MADPAASALLLAFDGTDPPRHVLDAVRTGQAAGVALYRSLNVRTLEQLRSMTETIQAAAVEGGQPPAIVAIDQEGGQLLGVGAPATPFAGNMALGATRSADLARRVGRAIGWELAALGITVDWAPVCDLATRPESPAVGTRAFTDDPALAAELCGPMVGGIQSTGVAATVKHFPGSGDTEADPHHGVSLVDVDTATLEARELVPFRAGIAAGARIVMASHGAYPQLEPDRANRSAMRSPTILRGLLRDRLGFDGVVVTDALDMNAVDQSDVPTAARRALDAGVDLLLAGPAQAERAAELEAIRQVLVSHPGATTSRRRVEELRRRLGGERPPLEVVGTAEHRALAAELARASITLIRDEGALLPLRPTPRGRLLAVTPRPADLTPADTSSLVELRLADAIRERHPGISSEVVAIDPGPEDIGRVCGEARGVDAVIVGTIDAFRHRGQQELVRALASVGPPVVLVALRSPLDAASMPEARTVVCTYSIHDPSTDAAAAVLFGELTATGQLPVSL